MFDLLRHLNSIEQMVTSSIYHLSISVIYFDHRGNLNEVYEKKGNLLLKRGVPPSTSSVTIYGMHMGVAPDGRLYKCTFPSCFKLLFKVDFITL